MTSQITIQPKFPLNETIQAHLSFYYRSGAFKRMLVYVVIFIALFTVSQFAKGTNNLFLIFGVLGLVCILVYTHFTIKKRTRKALLKNPRLKEDVTYIFNKKGLLEKGDTFEVQHLWSEYEKIKETKKNFFLYIDKRSAIILRKEDFGSQIADFKELMRNIPIKTQFKTA